MADTLVWIMFISHRATKEANNCIVTSVIYYISFIYRLSAVCMPGLPVCSHNAIHQGERELAAVCFHKLLQRV